ncbi:ADORA1 [Mytilus coruscus]|uniref:ADORA1 n=1 Tax=Mytilus coruscus TaxID=42192 RepID=A0A6J8AS16_MYTCO|nr:ADORA1 [Mytilus coruscus]
MITLNMTDDNYVLWYGLNGYGITCFYLGINILIFVVAIVAVLLNGIIIYILFGRDFREDVSCIFISHLALSDFLSAVLLFYNVIYNLIHFKHFYECAIRFGLVNGVFLNSSVILLSLTAERYAKILLPFKYASLITPEKAKYFMISSWVVCLVICQAPLFGWNQDTSEEYCRYFGVFTKNFLLIYCAIMYMMSFLVFLMYCHILCIAFKQNNKIRRADHRQINKRHTHIWWKPTKTAMIIVGINVVSWLPSGSNNIHSCKSSDMFIRNAF